MGIILCSLILMYSTIETQGSVVKNTAKEPKDTAKTQRNDGVHFFKKRSTITTSIVARVYEKGSFVGILLVDRGRPPLGPALPGGIVRYKEKPEDCVKRTLFDECGISSVSDVQQFKVYSDPARDPRMHAVDIVYSVRVDDQKITSGTDAKHAWICPIDKIPWDKLVFDHKVMLKAYLEHLITSSDCIQNPEKILLGSTAKSDTRNKNDFENIAKQAYRPPHLFVSGIIEVYEEDKFKGIALSDFQQDQKVKLLPGGNVVYGETIEQTFQRHLKEKFHAEASILCQFKTYSFFNDAGKKHDITAVFYAKADKKSLGSLQVYPLEEIPLEALGFHHKDIVTDYLKYRNGEKVGTCGVCIPAKGQ